MLQSMEINVVGLTFDGRQELIKPIFHEFLRSGKKKNVSLIHEPDNKYDPNALGVWVDNKHIGYISREFNEEILNQIENITVARIQDMGQPIENKPIYVKLYLEFKDE